MSRRTDRIPRIVRVAVLLLVSAAVLPVAAGEAEIDARQESRRLAAEAISLHHRADALESGYAEVYDRGIEGAERAIELDPKNADAHYALFLNLGRKSERSGVTAQLFGVRRLRHLLDRTLELDPRHAHAWEAKGEMLMQLPRLLGGSVDEGVRALERSASLDPSWPKPPLRLAEHYRRSGDTKRAREQAEKARDLADARGDDDYRSEAEAILREISDDSH